MHKNDLTAHKQILKSTGIIGGEQVFIVLAGVVRLKVIAVLLGPTGLGIAGIYQSTIDLIKNGTGFGIGFSAVREVAVASATNDGEKISRTVLILRRWAWGTGLFGMLLMLVFCRPLSQYTFGDSRHAWQFALLSVTLLTGAVSAGQLALLQGIRRIADLAKANVLGTLIGLAVAIPLFWIFRYDGIAYSLLAMAVGALICSWAFARRVPVKPVHLQSREIFTGGFDMIHLGFFTVLTAFLSTGTMYVVRLFIIARMNLDGVGQFQAAWTISSVYLATVLNAMGADYFPRLTGVHGDKQKMNLLINQQSEVALLIAGPMIVAMVSFCWLLLRLFYSAKFAGAVPIMQWQTLGMLIKLVQWPLGFVFLAIRKVYYFVASELLWNAAYFLLIYVGWSSLGIAVTGIAFLAAFVLTALFVNFSVRGLTGFRWSARNLWLMAAYGGLAAACLALTYRGRVTGYILATFLVCLAAWISVHYLRRIFDIRSLWKRFFN